MQKLECIQESLDSNFAEAMSEINNLRTDANARLSILQSTTDDLKTSLDAAWVEIEALKQQDEQNRLQLAEFAKENAQLQAEVSATKARAIKLDNYTRRENIRLLNVPESQDENFTRGNGRGQNARGGQSRISCSSPYWKTKR